MKLFLSVITFLIVSSGFSQTSGIIKIRKKSSNLLCLNGFTDGAIQSHLICGGKGLYVTGSERYKIVNFIILLEAVKQVEMKINGNVVTGEICDKIDYLKTGDYVYINSIRALDNNSGKEVTMPSLRFQIRGADTDPKKQKFNVMQEER